MEPVIPLPIARSRAVFLSGVSSTGIMMARWAILFYLPVYGIAVRGWSPAEGGVIMIPTNVGFAMGGLLVGWLHIRKATSYYMYATYSPGLPPPKECTFRSVFLLTILTSDRL